MSTLELPRVADYNLVILSVSCSDEALIFLIQVSA